jgi:hypothetical protein
MPDQHDASGIDGCEPSEDRFIITEPSISVELDEVLRDALDIV